MYELNKENVILNFLKFELSSDDFKKLTSIIEFERKEKSLLEFESNIIPIIKKFIMKHSDLLKIVDQIKFKFDKNSRSEEFIKMIDLLNKDMQVLFIVNQILTSQLNTKLKNELLKLFTSKITKIDDSHEYDLIIYDFMTHLQPLVNLKYKVNDLIEVIDHYYVTCIEKMDYLNFTSDKSDEFKSDNNGINQLNKNDLSEDESDESETEMDGLSDLNEDGIIDEKDMDILNIINGTTETELTQMIKDQYTMLDKLIKIYNAIIE